MKNTNFVKKENIMQLTDHFHLSEFVRSETATRLGIDNSINDPEIISNIRNLCECVLEPLRAFAGCPIIINSGYRCPRLNEAVGGSRWSQHMKGEACDIRIADSATGDRWYSWMKENLPYDQLIKELAHKSSGTVWIHVSLKRDEAKNRRQAKCLNKQKA